MVYKIEIIETLSKTVEIEAEDYTEAKRMYNDEEVVLTADNHTNTEFELII